MNLAELINSIKDKEGLTWRQLTDRAKQKGAPPPTGLFYLGDPNRPMVDFPRTKTIYGVAAALGVEPSVVAAAALKSLGLQEQNVVEVQAEEIDVVTRSDGDTPETRKGDRWIVITPDDQTSDEVLTALRSGANLRVISPSGDPSTRR
ncbi:hypothetical protein [Amycolatopsis taiwanensis]|uniref:hypothetical protein n=1 Tax=Amycolatopsis taiwanensis TaxID=342230 RepID=UPI0004B3C385|nr:hypothetical protein [Amycolatopsis taiwanensis]